MVEFEFRIQAIFLQFASQSFVYVLILRGKLEYRM